MDQKQTQKTFCPIPWSYLFVATDGSLLSCVIAQSTEGKGLVLNKDNAPMRASAPLDDFRNSEPLKKLRKAMLAGEDSPSICGRCMEEESFGLVSRRNLEKKKGYFTLDQARELTEADGSIDTKKVPISLFNMRLGNHCNLACHGCGPSQSSGWYEEWFKTRHRGFKWSGARHQLATNEAGKVFLPESPFYWYRDPAYWGSLLAQKEGIRELHFSGGEPFLSQNHLLFLEKLAAEGLGAEIALEYNSNLTVLPKRLTEVWRNFKKITVGVSIDGNGSMNDYVRFPSRFNAIEENLARLDGLPANVLYWATTTLSALNVGQFPDLVRWIYQSDLKKLNRSKFGDRFLSYHILRKPDYMSVKALPPLAKAVVRDRFTAFLGSWRTEQTVEPKDFDYVAGVLHSILSSMESEDRSDLSGKLLAEISTSDSFRKTDYSGVDGEIWRHLISPAREARAAP